MIVNTATSTNLLLAALLLFDWRTRGRLHSVGLTVVPPLVASEFVVSWIYHSPVARSVASAMPGPAF